MDAARLRDLAVGETEFLCAPQVGGGECLALIGDFLEVLEEPRIDGGGGVDFFDRPAVHEGGLQPEDALGIRDLQLAGDFLLRCVLRLLAVEAEAPAAGFQRAQALLHAFLEGAADGHRFADRLHRGREHRVGGGEFFESETRDLGDHIVDGRFERCGRFARDVVGQFVERVTDCKLRGDFCDRKSGRFRGERRRAGNARVHLDDDHAAGLRVGGKLDV